MFVGGATNMFRCFLINTEISVLFFSPESKSDGPAPEFKCRIIQEGSLEIVPVRPRAVVWIGANNLNQAATEDFFTAAVKRVVRHAQTYLGGGTYGKFGGYDITLLELDTVVPPAYGTPACLPTASFKDTHIKAHLAGYGQFYRRDKNNDNKQKCQTDEYGRNKYHMCRDPGSGDEICHLDRPAPQTPACQAFANETHQPYPEEYEEIQLVDEKGSDIDFCFDAASPKKQSRGWCETNETYYSYEMVREAGWGFCGPDCFLGAIRKEKESSVLRQVRDVDVLPEAACDAFLKSNIGSAGLEVMPQILCVGRYRPWRTQVWQKLGRGWPSYTKQLLLVHPLKGLLRSVISMSMVYGFFLKCPALHNLEDFDCLITLLTIIFIQMRDNFYFLR